MQSHADLAERNVGAGVKSNHPVLNFFQAMRAEQARSSSGCTFFVECALRMSW
jgi:hypothetical protein